MTTIHDKCHPKTHSKCIIYPFSNTTTTKHQQFHLRSKLDSHLSQALNASSSLHTCPSCYCHYIALAQKLRSIDPYPKGSCFKVNSGKAESKLAAGSSQLHKAVNANGWVSLVGGLNLLWSTQWQTETGLGPAQLWEWGTTRDSSTTAHSFQTWAVCKARSGDSWWNTAHSHKDGYCIPFKKKMGEDFQGRGSCIAFSTGCDSMKGPRAHAAASLQWSGKLSSPRAPACLN